MTGRPSPPTQPAAGWRGPSPAPRPGRSLRLWLVLATVLLVIGLVGFTVFSWTLAAAGGSDLYGMDDFTVGADHNTQLNPGFDMTVWVQTEVVDPNAETRTQLPPGASASCQVHGRDGSPDPRVAPSVNPDPLYLETGDDRREVWLPVADFSVTQFSRLTIRCEPIGAWRTFGLGAAVRQPPAGRVLGSFAIGVTGFGLGGTVLLVALIRRARSRRAGRYPAAPEPR